MTAPELIARLDALGATMHVSDGKPRLRFGPGTNPQTILAALGDDLTTHREAVLAHFRPVEIVDHPGRVCLPCGATVYHESAEEQFRFCGRACDGERAGSVLCPAWKPGLPTAPDWLGRARDWAAYQAKQKRQQQEREEQPIPE